MEGRQAKRSRANALLVFHYSAAIECSPSQWDRKILLVGLMDNFLFKVKEECYRNRKKGLVLRFVP